MASINTPTYQSVANFESLPPEIVTHIFSYLVDTPKDLANATSICKKIYHNTTLWKTLLRERLPNVKFSQKSMFSFAAQVKIIFFRIFDLLRNERERREAVEKPYNFLNETLLPQFQDFMQHATGYAALPNSSRSVLPTTIRAMGCLATALNELKGVLERKPIDPWKKYNNQEDIEALMTYKTHKVVFPPKPASSFNLDENNNNNHPSFPVSRPRIPLKGTEKIASETDALLKEAQALLKNIELFRNMTPQLNSSKNALNHFSVSIASLTNRLNYFRS